MSTSDTVPDAAHASDRPRRTRITLLVAALVVAAGIVLAIRPLLIDSLWPSLTPGTIGYQAVVQVGGLAVAALTLLAAYGLSSGRIRGYWGIGNLAAPAGRIRWLGVKKGLSWRRLGLVMLAWISALLSAFLYIGLAKDLSKSLSPVLLLCAVLFAVTNAVAEEVVFRLSLVGVLRDVVGDRTILALGAGIFGAIHFVGVPGGPIGVLMAGFLGWFLTKSILETRGVFWAVLIHVVQDIIIFGFLLHL